MQNADAGQWMNGDPSGSAVFGFDGHIPFGTLSSRQETAARHDRPGTVGCEIVFNPLLDIEHAHVPFP